MVLCEPAPTMHLVSQELFPLSCQRDHSILHVLSALGTAQGAGRIEEGEFKKLTRKNYSTHYQIHLPVLKPWPHSSLHSGQPHSIQNKACCWRLQNINNSKVCTAAGGKTTRGSAPQGWHKEQICFRLPAKGTGKLDFFRGCPKMLFYRLQYSLEGFCPDQAVLQPNAGGKYPCSLSSLSNWYCCFLMEHSPWSLSILQIKASGSMTSCHTHGAF